MNCDEEASMCYLFYIAAIIINIIISLSWFTYKLLSWTAFAQQIMGRNKLKYITNVFSVCKLYILLFFQRVLHRGNNYIGSNNNLHNLPSHLE